MFDLATRAGVSVLGPLPRRACRHAVPFIDASESRSDHLGGIAVALVSFADTSVLSRTYAARLRTPVDPNQEMVGLGIANLADRVLPRLSDQQQFLAHPGGRSGGREDAADGRCRGARDCRAAPRRRRPPENLPNTALAAVVIASAIGLFEVADLRRIYRIQRWEFWLSMTCFAGVAALGAIPGIALAIVIAVIEFLWDGWRPHSAVLGRVDHVKGYHDITRYPDAKLHSGPRALSVGCAVVLRQCRVLPRTRAGRGRELADAGPLARDRGRARHQR